MILVTLMQSKKKSTPANPKNNSNNNGMRHSRHSARFKLNSSVWCFSHIAFRFPEKIASKAFQNIPINSNTQQTSQLVVLHRGSPLHLCFADSVAITSTLCKVLFWIAAAQNLTSCLLFQKYRFFFCVAFIFFWSVIFHKNCCWFLKILPFVEKKIF